jgi:allophanate hydrolase
LIDAGAIPIGKTALDQFAIGLVGIRTRGKSCSCVFHPDYIPGGSSAGSAVSVAAGLVSFSLGNDAAGSGRVPAALNNIVGIKPTPGLVSNRAVSGGGVVRSIETISVFALDCPDGMEVLRLIAGYDPQDAFSRPEADAANLSIGTLPPSFAFGIPDDAHLEFFGDAAAARLFEKAIHRLEEMGGSVRRIDYSAFAEAQKILYEGPWISERTAWLEPVVERYREHLHPVTRSILESGNQYSAKDLFRAMHRLAELRQRARAMFRGMDVLLVPTVPTTYTKAQVESDPIALNARLGIYTNFTNLLGMCGVAVPNGLRPDGLALGVTFLALELSDGVAATFADAYLKKLGLETGNFPARGS